MPNRLRSIRGDNWTFDGKALTVHIPMEWKRRGGRKVIIAPDGSDSWAPAKPRPDETLIRALARAHRWKRLLEEGTYRSVAELAEAEKINRAYVCRLLNFTLLDPEICEAVLDGRQPPDLALAALMKPIPVEWHVQQRVFGLRQEAVARGQRQASNRRANRAVAN